MCVWELFIYNGKSWLSDFYTLGQQTHRVTVSYNHASMWRRIYVFIPKTLTEMAESIH